MQNHSLSQLPGPKGLPIIGNILQIELTKLHLILEQWADSYGQIYKIKLLNKIAVVISNPELIHNIMRDRPDTYRRIAAMEKISREHETHGVLTAEGDEWRWQRSIAMQAFRPECLKKFYPSMKEILMRLYTIWRNSAEFGKEVNVEHDWMRLMVDITTNFAFGYDINTLETENNSFQQHLERQLPFFNRRVNSPLPYWHIFSLPSDREANASLAVIKETIQGFILQTQERFKKNPELKKEPINFLEALLVAQDEQGRHFSYQEIQGNIISILLAGEDTSAHTLSWALYLITENPEVQIKMQQEADSVLADNVIPQDLIDLDKLNYIEAVLHETMRLKSVVPVTFLETNIDVELQGLAIPKGTTLMLLTRYIAMQEKNFTDAKKFKPERWLESNQKGCIHNRNASIPFGSGPRFCAARNLAMMEMKMAMAMVCKNFNVSRVNPDQPVQEVFSFTLMPDNLKVKLEKRKPI